MEMVEKGSEIVICATENKKAKAIPVRSSPTNIMDYFKRSTLPETSKELPKEHVKIPVNEPSMEGNIQSDNGKESVTTCIQQTNCCKDSEFDSCTASDQNLRRIENEDIKSKCQDIIDNCEVHHEGKSNGSQDVFPHCSDIQDGGTSSCTDQGDQLSEDNHLLDSDDDAHIGRDHSHKLSQANKRKWNFTWKATKKCSKSTKPDSAGKEPNHEKCVDHPHTDQNKCINQSMEIRKRKKKNKNKLTVHKDHPVLSTENLQSADTPVKDVREQILKTDVTNTSYVNVSNGGFVGKHDESSPEAKKSYCNIDSKHCENILSDLSPPLTSEVEESSCDIEQDVKSAGGKFEKSKKSYFDVLMQSSKDRALAKRKSLEDCCKKSEENMINLTETGNVDGKVDVVKGKDGKISAQTQAPGVENSKKDRKGSKTRRKKPRKAKSKSFPVHNPSDDAEEMINNESECQSTELSMRRSSRISAKITRNEDTFHGSSEADDMHANIVVEKPGTKKQKRKKGNHLKKEQLDSLKQSSSKKEIEIDVDCEPSAYEEKETLLSVEKSKSGGSKQHVPQKATGPVAPIFLPGAWQRGKQKVEQEQLQESLIEVDEIDGDPVLSGCYDHAITVFEETNNSVKSISSNGYSPRKDVSQRMQEFMGMFKKSPVKSNVAIVQLIDAPFPKVSHVLQINDELQQKWNLPMVNNRFVKEEFFIWADEKFNTSTELCLSELLPNVAQNLPERLFNCKSSQTNKLPEISEVEKEAAVAYLKQIYPGVSVKRLFKRCRVQLERCRKAEMETRNSERHIETCNREPQLCSKNAIYVDNSRPSAKQTFTRISGKETCIVTEVKKIAKEKDGPLLMAFRKQSRRTKFKCNEEDTQISDSHKNNKNLPAKSSLRDYFVVPQTIVDDSSRKPATEHVLQAKSNKTKRKHEDSGVCLRKTNSTHPRKSTVEDCKKRERESQNNVENLDEIVVENIGPAKKKVKVMVDDQDSKHKKKGGKARKNREKEVVSVKDATRDTANVRKKSSDDDFVKTSKRTGKSATRKDKGRKRSSRASGDDEQTGLRKSGRLQEKLAKMDNKKEDSENKGDREIEGMEINKKEGLEQQAPEIYTTSETEAKDVDIVEVISQAIDVQKKQHSREILCETEDEVGQGLPILWTECFKPAKSEEILGNISAGSKLKKWLSEWKSLREKKLNEIRRLQEKKKNKRGLASRDNEDKSAGTEWWYEDDEAEDFDLSSDSDYSDEEDLLCNTMLLTGPTGCGKTSAVYACAEELGFKVIEVNSSSKRGGKYILSELQEATQSYQVAGKRTSSAPDGIFSLASSSVSPDAPSKMLYENVKKKKKAKKKESGKKKMEKSSQSRRPPEGQMSLILLDEVDILFEEDKGFWVAVNSIRLNSKRPIVMTASDPCVNIDGRFEHILMKSPSRVNLHAAHLQTVCLSKDVFVHPPEIQALAMLHHGDIRQSLLALQFWMESGAGECDPHGTSFKTETEICGSNLKNCGRKASDNEPDDKSAVSKTQFSEEFIKPENSKALSDAVESHGPTQMSELKEEGLVASSQHFPVHQLYLESLLGLRNIASIDGGALKVLSVRGKKDNIQAKHSFVCKSSIASHCQALGFDIARCNLATLLPCLFACNYGDDVGESSCLRGSNINEDHNSLKVEPGNEKENDLKGRSEELLEIFHDTSVFDDGTDEGGCGDQVDFVEAEKQHSSTLSGDCVTIDQEEERENQQKISIRNKLVTISLEAFTRFVDDMSFLDSDLCCEVESNLRQREVRFGNRHAQVIPGVEDKVETKTTQLTCKSRATLTEIRGVLEVASLEGSHQRFHERIEKAGLKQDSLDLISNIFDSQRYLCPAFEESSGIVREKLAHDNKDEDCKHCPILDSVGSCNLASNPSLQLFTLGEIFMSKTKRRRNQDFEAVTQYLSDTQQLNTSSLALDYFPTLRDICRKEENRRESRTKRRFYHYFDNVGLNFPQSTIQSLTDDTFSNYLQDMK